MGDASWLGAHFPWLPLVFRSLGVQKVSPVWRAPPPSAATQPGAALGSPCQWCFLASWQEQLMGRGSRRSNCRQVTPQTQGMPFSVSPVARRGGKLLVGWSCPAAQGNPADSSVQKTAGISSIDRCKSKNKSDCGQITVWLHLKRWSWNLLV